MFLGMRRGEAVGQMGASYEFVAAILVEPLNQGSYLFMQYCPSLLY